MTETPESPSTQRASRLSQAAAWVGIVAGVVFIVGAVFFSGFFLASRLEHRSGPQVMHCEMGGSGEGKGGMGPMGPSQSPSPTSTPPPTPTTPRP